MRRCVSDFGFAQYMGTAVDFSIRGSPLYMAPEIILQQHYDAKVFYFSMVYRHLGASQ